MFFFSQGLSLFVMIIIWGASIAYSFFSRFAMGQQNVTYVCFEQSLQQQINNKCFLLQLKQVSLITLTLNPDH